MTNKKNIPAAKPATSKPAAAAAPAKAAPKPTGSTPVRNTPIPMVAAVAAPAAAPAARREVTHDRIAARAYEIWHARGGSADANWLAAEAELRAA